MARSSSGKSVARAASTGGGATYRGSMPVNWYAGLVAIVILGLASVGFAKYHYNQTTPVVQPTTTTTWHAALGTDICGTMQTALAASPTSSSTGLTTTGSGVLLIAPKKASESGDNATLGKFASEYKDFTLTNSSLKYPGAKSEYKNGEACPAGTPDAGKKGIVMARSWLLSTKESKGGEEEETGGHTTESPADLKFADRQLITLGFAPSGTELPKPPSAAITGLLQVLAEGSQPVATTTSTPTASTAVTTTTSASGSTTSQPATSTTTSAPLVTSTTKATTTTSVPATTTTSKPSG